MQNRKQQNFIRTTACPKQRGFTLLEMFIYISLLSIITIAVINVFFSETNAWANARAERNASDAGRLIMERIVQEVKLARSVNTSASILGAPSGKLVLETFESVTSTVPSTLEIFLDGQELKLKKGTESSVSLSGSARVQELIFHHLTSPESQAVRILLTVEVSQGRFSKTKTFTTAAVLRGSY